MRDPVVPEDPAGREAFDEAEKRLASGEDVSQAPAQAAAFYREVAVGSAVWTVPRRSGIPRADEPFGSSRARAERLIAASTAYSAFSVVEIPWAEFCERWIPGLERDGFLAGLNWPGPRATGHDIEPARVLENIRGAGSG